MSDDVQSIEAYLDHLRGHIQVRLARAGVPADRDTLQMVCLAIGQTVMDPAHLQLLTMPPPPHLLPAIETVFTSVEVGFADEIAELRDVIADAQDDPAWQTQIHEALQAGELPAEQSLQEHIARLVLSRFVELDDGSSDYECSGPSRMIQESREASMPFSSADIYPLAQRLHAQLPHKAWPRDIGFWEDFTHVADELRAACRQAKVEEPQATIIAEALAGLVYHWGSRYRRLDAEIAKATDVLVTALGGTLRPPGMYALQAGTPITIAAIAHLIGWVTILEVEES